MIKRMTCIECPQGCALAVDIDDCRVREVKGAKCPKGKAYAIAETECPSRILTSTVRTSGMDLKFVPVRTDKAIPKKDIQKAMQAIGDIRLSRPVVPGTVVVDDFLGAGVKLISTRRARMI